MTLPTFLGIGAPRSGSTWLHELLASHPEVYVPVHRKEVKYFNREYGRGLHWYEKFFPVGSEAARYRAIGEISPGYLYCHECPERIADVPSISQLLLILRNPANRLYSGYGRRVREEKLTLTFEDFLSSQPHQIQDGFYSQWLANYFRYFEREQLLVLVYEQALANVPETEGALARFLGIDEDRFSFAASARKINRGFLPRYQSVAGLVYSTARLLRKWDMDRAVHWVKGLGVQRLYGDAGSLPPMKEETRRYLEKVYKEEVVELEALLGMDLSCWR